jgi:hypothetical protein
LEPNELTHPWELTKIVANSRTYVLEYLELAHMHKGEEIGEEKEKTTRGDQTQCFELTGPYLGKGPNPPDRVWLFMCWRRVDTWHLSLCQTQLLL